MRPPAYRFYELDFVIDGATQLDIVGIGGDTLYFGVEEDKSGPYSAVGYNCLSENKGLRRIPMIPFL